MRIGKPEVLAPAGSPESLRAAIGAGADAVYFGMTDFNARIRARNFELGDLREVVADLRRWGVRSYIVFNTLVFAEEMAAARDALEAISLAGPDGIIVQDLGVLRLVRRVAPHLPVHASTQMTVASADGVRLATELGARRVILARELTLPEIDRIRAQVETELEVFVHGALCVSYSGQCLSSEAWGGRSANRGQCAQACRLPYDLIVDGKWRDLGDRAYLLSPRDLEGFRRIPELTAVGISAFKIEGRMKSAEYVAASTALYRAAVDRAWEERASTAPKTPKVPAKPAQAELERLASDARQIFSRGASEGFLAGINHQSLVDGTTRAHQGVRAGKVVRVEGDRAGRETALILEVEDPARGEPPVRLKPGDGVLLRVTSLEEDEVGGRILSVEPLGRSPHVRLRFPREACPDLSCVRPGTPVHRTSDPDLQDRLRRGLSRPADRRRVTLDARIEGAPGAPLRLELTDPEGRSAAAVSSIPCEPARSRPFDAAFARAQLDRLGETRYRLGACAVEGDGAFFLPVSEINRLRREAVDRMESLRGELRREEPAGGGASAAASGEGAWPGSSAAAEEISREDSPVVWAVERAAAHAGIEPGAPSGAGRPSAAIRSIEEFESCCIVLCRDSEQVRGAVEAGARRIVLDFLDLVGLKAAAAELRRLGIGCTLALPRVQKVGEERIESFFLGLEPDGILVRSLGGVRRLWALRRERAGSPAEVGTAASGPARQFPEIIGDVSLNAVNPEAIEILLGLGLARVSPGLDLNGEQLEGLVGRVDAARIEIPIYHHLPVFHTEHCVFAAFLGEGADFRSCDRPCDRHRILLRDRTGQSHPVVADVGCRNTVFGARAQSTLAHLAPLRRAGVSHFRVELISEDQAATRRLVDLHRRVWGGELSGAEALRVLHAESAYGISLGVAEPPRTLAARPAGSRAKPAGRGLSRRRSPQEWGSSRVPRAAGRELAPGRGPSRDRVDRRQGVADDRRAGRASKTPRRAVRTRPPDPRDGRNRSGSTGRLRGTPDAGKPRRSEKRRDNGPLGRTRRGSRPGRSA